MRPLSPSSRRRPAKIDALEPRLVMSGTMMSITAPSQEAAQTPVTNVEANLSAPAMNSIPLAGDATHPVIFADPNVPGTITTFQTSKGNIVVSLTDAATPKTVANFLSYVNSGAYDQTIFHRSALDAQSTQQTPVPISTSNPAGIIQGGGYTVGAAGLTHIATNAPVADEYTTELYGDLPGTLAMAKTADANSATSEWFFNNLDETAGLDTPTTDPNGVQTSYTVFGKVLSGMSVITAIADLPTASLNTTGGGTTPAPITGLTQTQITANAAVGASNLVYTYGITTEANTTYTVTSSDPSLVAPSVTNGVLSFKYASGRTGTAAVTVTATDAYDQTAASTTFAVTVPPASSTATAPITAPDTVPAVVTGVATVVQPLANDTDATSALNPASLAIVTQPAHGTATVDAANGTVSYTATGGYAGTDTFTYTVADSNGKVSAPTTVTLAVVPTPLAVTVGSGKVRSVAFTQPDGAKGVLSLGGATAVVTFSAGDVTTRIANGVETVSGAGATIANVVVSNGKVASPTVSLGGKVTLGGLTDVGSLAQLVAPSATLDGTLSVGGLKRLVLAAASHAVVTVGPAEGATVVQVGTATDTSMSIDAITSLTSKAWAVDDGGSYQVDAGVIGNLSVSGAFGDGLVVSSGAGYAINSLSVGGALGAWEVNGGVRRATVAGTTAGWSLSDGSVIRQLTVRGNLSGTVSAGDIDAMTVTGAMTNATVETSGLFNAATVQLQRLSIAGAMTNSVVYAAGNIGTVSAASMSGSRVYAGVGTTVSQAGGLPASTNDLLSEATIRAVTLGGGATFASSEIAAYVLDAVRLGKVTTANGGAAFGLSAHMLGTVNATLNPGGALVLGKAQLKSAAVLAAYVSQRKLALADFKIVLY